MWITPSNPPLYSAFAAECVASKEESKELLEKSELLLMWKSKPLLSKTFFRLWNRVYWIPRLFGRILKPSRQKNFTEKYTALWEVILVSRTATPDSEREQKTPDTFGRLYSGSSEQLDLFGASLKTCPDTSQWDSIRFTKTFQTWVTMLKQEYTARKKSALLIREKGCSFSQSTAIWRPTDCSDKRSNKSKQQGLSNQVKRSCPTPLAWDIFDRNTKFVQGGTPLSLQVKQWGTPTAVRRVRRKETMEKCLAFRNKNGQSSVPLYLEEQVLKNWPTPKCQCANSPGLHGSGGLEIQTAVSNWRRPVAHETRLG